MDVIIKASVLQFKNPYPGQPTRACEEHYIGRRITALVDGQERTFRFKREELPFVCDEDAMVAAIECRQRGKSESDTA